MSWLCDDGWVSFEYVDHDSGYADDEDILWWLLTQGASLELVRPALAAAYPGFDVDAAVDWRTMPDRVQRHAEDAARRETLKREFRARPPD